MRSLHSSKAIYQAGALRKVCLGEFLFDFLMTSNSDIQAKGVSVYQDLCVHLNGHGMVRLQSLHFSLRVSVPDMVGPLHVHHALVSQNGLLVNIGEYVCYSDSHKVRMPCFGP